MEQAVAIGRIESTLDSHNSRISGLHKRLGEVQVQQGDQHTEIKVIGKEMEEARKDIEESKRELTNTIGAVRTELNSTINTTAQGQSDATKQLSDRFEKKFETLTTAVRWGTGTLITLIGILLAILFQVHS